MNDEEYFKEMKRRRGVCYYINESMPNGYKVSIDVVAVKDTADRSFCYMLVKEYTNKVIMTGFSSEEAEFYVRLADLYMLGFNEGRVKGTMESAEKMIVNVLDTLIKGTHIHSSDIPGHLRTMCTGKILSQINKDEA